MKAHYLFILLFTCTLFSLACTSCNKKPVNTPPFTGEELCSSGLPVAVRRTLTGVGSQDQSPVDVPSSIFWNRDSLNYYAAVAYKDDDPKGQFVTGAAYYLQREGDMPADFYTVSREEADSFLMLSAGQDYQPAKDLIRCLQQHNQWNH